MPTFRRIDSPSNPILVRARSLRDSRRRRWTERAFLVEGPRFIADFLAAGLSPVALLLAESFPLGSPLRAHDHVVVDDRTLADVSGTEHGQGAVAIFPFPELGWEARRPRLVLALDGVQDPGNVGTLVRSAAASGTDAVWFLPGSADPFSPKVIRAAAAAHAVVGLDVGPFELVRQLGLRVVVADGGPDATPLDEVAWDVPSLLVLGNEGSGVSDGVRAHADLTVAVPISGRVESLNVAVAGSVILFEVARQHRLAARMHPPEGVGGGL